MKKIFVLFINIFILLIFFAFSFFPTGKNNVVKAAGPYSVNFATYIGGHEWENIRGMTTDSQGNIYITGGTNSANYPTTFGPANQSGTPSTCISIACSEIFVTKLSPDGQTVIWSRFIGTSGHDRAYGVKYHEVGGVGYLLLYGRMGKNYTMTPGVFQAQFQGPDFPNSGYGWQNGFVAKLNPLTGNIIWISYVGTETLVRNADVDDLGNVYIITGYRSPSFVEPSPCAPHVAGCVPWYDKFVGRAYPTPPGGTTDLVLLKVSHDGSAVYWATYFGGPGSEDAAGGIAVNKATKEFYIMGQSTSAGLATPGIFSQGASLHGGKDFLIAKFNSSATSRLWSGYVGGSAEEPYGCKNILLDSSGNVIIAAPSTSADLPTTPGAFQRTPGGGNGNSFVAKISADGATYAATFVAGNSAMSNVEGFDINSRGEIVVGFELSGTTNFPVTSDAIQSNYPGTKNGAIAVLSSDLSHLIYSTLYGGGGDGFRALAVDSNDNIIAAGHSESGNFPTYNAYDSTRNISSTHYWGGDDWDGILLKLSHSGSVPDTTPPAAPSGVTVN